MDAARAEIAAAPQLAARPKVDSGRLRDIVLVRIATAGRTLTREALAKELTPCASHLVAASECRQMFDRDIAALADAGLVEVRAVGVEATEAGRKRAVLVLGGSGGLPRSWAEARDVRLVAKALGIEREPLSRLKALAKPDGLRALIVQRALGLKIKGVATPSRLRAALAAVALEKAFGHRLSAGVAAKTGLSAKAGRLLAGQLSATPQDYRTDSRLIGALAAEHAGTARGDFAALQLALLRRYVAPGAAVASLPAASASRDRKSGAAARSRVPAAKAAPPPATPKPTLVAPTPAPSIAAQPPSAATAPPPHGLDGFVAVVGHHAARVAEGWPGNRKAFISRIWRSLVAAGQHRGVSEIEFKCMLAEAHRAGGLVLVNADLKDGRTIKDVQDSAVSFKNAVFHYVRVDK